MRFAVIAGTPVDTQMGVDELRQRNCEAVGFPAASDPVEQTQLQIAPHEERNRKVSQIIEEIKAQAYDGILVYCNSMSSAIDFRELAKEHGIKIVTPLDVYRATSKKFGTLAVIAANNQGLSGIERAFVEESPETIVIGMASLKLVLDVEAGTEPRLIVERNGLKDVAAAFETSGAEALVLGCTHFPYFKAELEALTDLPVIDPMDEMFRLLSDC